MRNMSPLRSFRKKRERKKIRNKKEKLVTALSTKGFMHQTVKAESGSSVKIFLLDQKTFQRKEYTHHIRSPPSCVLCITQSMSKGWKLTKATPRSPHLLILMKHQQRLPSKLLVDFIAIRTSFFNGINQKPSSSFMKLRNIWGEQFFSDLHGRTFVLTSGHSLAFRETDRGVTVWPCQISWCQL